MTDSRSARLCFFDAAPSGWPRRVGGVQVDNPVWLAPLAGITFSTFRLFHKALGAGLVHTEMVSALGLIYKGRKTKELLYGDERESPCVLQLFGSKACDIEKGAEAALSIRAFDALEINMACPMPKVTRKGAGARLLEYPDEAGAIIKGLRRFGFPVWAKVRLMPGGSRVSTEAFCRSLFENGADLVLVHGRTPAQRYEGAASRDAVGEIASLFPGMVVGSGDCYAPEDFEDYLARGCVAALAGRGVLKDAYLIPKTLHRLGVAVPEAYSDPQPEDQVQILLELGRSIYNTEGESLALTIAKRMLVALFKGFKGAPQLRRAGALAKRWDDMEFLLLHWRDETEAPATR